MTWHKAIPAAPADAAAPAPVRKQVFAAIPALVRSTARTLVTGLRLSMLGTPRVSHAELSTGVFWILALLGVLLSSGLDYFSVEPPRSFNLDALHSEGFYLLITLLICFVIVRAFGRDALLWPFATLGLSTAVWTDSIVALVQDHFTDALSLTDWRWPWVIFLVACLWWTAVWRGVMTALDIGRGALQRSSVALLVVAVFVGLSYVLYPTRFWEEDYAAKYEAERATAPPDLVAEEVFFRQPELLERALSAMPAGRTGVPDLYFVAFGPYGEQDVFLKESLYAAHQFETRFGARGRALALVNNRQKVDELPLATVTNLGHVLRQIGRHMDPTEDILFLFLTSHGSADAELSIELDNISFKPLTAAVLGSLLGDSGIQWKVLVISGCYSGSFIEQLKDDRTLIISAARSDRRSFGCSDGAEFTYFGRAFFKEALNRTDSFVDAFAIARTRLAQWEAAEGREPSEPQMVSGPAIETQLKAWQQTLRR